MDIPCRKHESMALHCTFKTGGEADMFYEPETAGQLRDIIEYLKSSGTGYTVIGRGSNLLVSDGGVRGAVVTTAKMADVSLNGSFITAMCGATLYSAAALAAKNSLTGLEFAAGIPGSTGGGVAMNAGAYGGELKDCLVSVTALGKDGNIYDIPKENMDMSYRHSRILDTGEIVLSAVFSLKKGNKEEIEAQMKDLAMKRSSKQPLNFPSAGSTFKRPEGHFAGTLIEQCGLKGYAVGGAQVSEKHAGFIINKGGASSSDIYALICHVQRTVFEKSGVRLEPEVRLLGDFE